MDRTRVKVRAGLVALPLLGVLVAATACGDDGNASNAGESGTEPGGAVLDRQAPADEQAAMDRYDLLAALDWCEEIGTEAAGAVVGPIDDTESDNASTFGYPGCRFSAGSDAYTITLPLTGDLSVYREDDSGQSEAPVDLDGPGLDAVYQILPTERGEINTLQLYVEAEPFIVVEVKVDAYSLDEGAGARDRDVALERAIDMAELALAAIAAN